MVAGASRGRAPKFNWCGSISATALRTWHLVAGTTPDNKYIDTVVKLAQRGALFLFDLGYFKIKASGADCGGRGLFSHAPQPPNGTL